MINVKTNKKLLRFKKKTYKPDDEQCVCSVYSKTQAH